MIEQSLTAHVQGIVRQLACEPDHATAAQLSAFLTTWQLYVHQVQAIRQIFIHMERVFMLSHVADQTIWHMGVRIFAGSLSSEQHTLSAYVQGICDAIDALRRAQTSASTDAAPGLIRMLQLLGLYNSAFEQPFLARSKAFFESWCTAELGSCAPDEYLKLVEGMLQAEAERAAALLAPHTHTALLTAAEQALIEPAVQPALSDGFAELVSQRKVPQLNCMFKLFHRLGPDAVKGLCGTFASYVKGAATAIVQNKEADKTMIPSLLALKDLVDDILCDAFQGHVGFAQAVHSALTDAVNLRTSVAAQLLAKFVSAKLKAGGKVEADSTVDAVLDRAMVIFRTIRAKDVFEEFYKKDLAKRLLLSRSASAELERGMLQRLKTECGAAFTAKLEGMFKDMAASEAFFNSWLEQTPESARGDVPAHFQILTASHWPPYPAVPGIVYPAQLKSCLTSFEAYFYKTYGARKLEWSPSLSHVVLTADFRPGTRELAVSLYQALVLMCYDEPGVAAQAARVLTLDDLHTRTGIPMEDLKLTLASLSIKQVRMLIKSPKTKEMALTDTFTLNQDFTSKQLRLKINQIQLKETRKEVAETHKRVQEERQYQTDACIVRIMKSRTTLSHRELIAEIMSAVRFDAEAAYVKSRIESLIQREYMERDDDDPSIYHYLA